MTNEEAFRFIGERAEELSRNPKVKEFALSKYQNGTSLKEIQNWIYGLAIATLCGEEALVFMEAEK